MRTFDAIVIGLGAMGSAAVNSLSRRGLRVCGIDRFSPPHDQGSSHGQTRICRKAYFEHPDYVPLLHAAYDAWAQLEAEAAAALFVRNGLILSGPPDSALITGVQDATRLHRLSIDDLSGLEAQRRYPQFVFPEDWRVLVEADAGHLRVEEALQAQHALAERNGATLLRNTQVRDWRADGDGFVVASDQESLRAERLVLTAGAWVTPLLQKLQVPLRIERRQQTWFRCEDPGLDNGCPVFGFHVGDGFYYGFPRMGRNVIKAAEHLRAQPCDPETVHRGRDAEDERRMRSFFDRFLPGKVGDVDDHSVCLYTMTPDEHFILDTLPDHPGVAIAAGFSGHGFKFGPLVGEILSDLVQTGQTHHPIEFLRLNRFC